MEKIILKNIKDNLNATGIFLESYVYDFFIKRGGYGVKRESPYHINVGVGAPLDGECDIVAASQLDSDTLVCFVIECKRALVEQKFWVFEKGHPRPAQPPQLTYTLPSDGPNFRTDIHLPDLGYRNPADYESAINIYEFDDKWGKRVGNFDKRERAFIGLRQVNEAFSGLATGPHFAMGISGRRGGGGLNILYLPLVVTTASLLVADYETADIDSSSGNILDTEKINLIEKGWVHFDFPLSGALRTNYGGYDKRATFVVNIDHFEDFITSVENNAKAYLS